MRGRKKSLVRKVPQLDQRLNEPKLDLKSASMLRSGGTRSAGKLARYVWGTAKLKT
jgi:hypothetical protein